MDIDPNRLNRVHVVAVQLKNDVWYIVLSDKSTVPWDVWITMSRKERWGY